MLRRFWDAALALDPAAAGLDEGIRFPICAPDPLRRTFEGAGFVDVAVEPIDIETLFRDFDDYWSPFTAGIGPAPAYVADLDSAGRQALRERLRSTLPIASNGTIRLSAAAWAVRGMVPG